MLCCHDDLCCTRFWYTVSCSSVVSVMFMIDLYVHESKNQMSHKDVYINNRSWIVYSHSTEYSIHTHTLMITELSFLGWLLNVAINVHDVHVSSLIPPKPRPASQPDQTLVQGLGEDEETRGETQDEKRWWTAVNKRNDNKNAASETLNNEKINHQCNSY